MTSLGRTCSVNCGFQRQAYAVSPIAPLVTPETDPEALFRKGKASEEEASITELGSPPYPSVGAPFSPPQLFDRHVSAVSRFLNFGSVPIEFPSPGPGPEG